MPDAVAKLFVPSGYTFERLDYPAGAWPFTGLSSDTVGQSIAVGVPTLNDMIRTAVAANDGPVVVTGVSLGAMVVEQEMRNLATQSDAPQPSQLSFVLVADPTDRGGGFAYLPYTYMPILNMVMQPFPQTPYNVAVIRQLYDGVSSFPDRPWHLLADLNAVFGLLTFHTSDHFPPGLPSGRGRGVPASRHHHRGELERWRHLDLHQWETGGPALTHLLDPYAPALFQFINRLITPIIDLGYSSKTPNAGPHFAPGGALVNNNGQPVFASQAPAAPFGQAANNAVGGESCGVGAQADDRPGGPEWRVAEEQAMNARCGSPHKLWSLGDSNS